MESSQPWNLANPATKPDMGFTGAMSIIHKRQKWVDWNPVQPCIKTKDGWIGNINPAGGPWVGSQPYDKAKDGLTGINLTRKPRAGRLESCQPCNKAKDGLTRTHSTLQQNQTLLDWKSVKPAIKPGMDYLQSCQPNTRAKDGLMGIQFALQLGHIGVDWRPAKEWLTGVQSTLKNGQEWIHSNPINPATMPPID